MDTSSVTAVCEYQVFQNTAQTFAFVWACWIQIGVTNPLISFLRPIPLVCFSNSYSIFTSHHFCPQHSQYLYNKLNTTLWFLVCVAAFLTNVTNYSWIENAHSVSSTSTNLLWNTAAVRLKLYTARWRNSAHVQQQLKSTDASRVHRAFVSTFIARWKFFA